MMEAPAEFAEWYRVQHSGLVRTLTAAIGDVDAAREATDEAFARALERWARVSTMDSPVGWVYRVGLNVARRRARRAAFERRLGVGHSPGSVVMESVDAELWAAVRRLPARQRTAVALRYIGDFSEAAIAEVMGVAVGTVSATLHSARRRLAADLSNDVRESSHD